MSTADWEERIAYHELAHALAALEFGHSVNAISIVPGQHYGGIMIHRSRTLTFSERELDRAGDAMTAMDLPARLRRRLETSAMISLAGPCVDELVHLSGERSASYVEEFVPPAAPISERTAERLTDLLAAADTPGGRSDSEHAFDVASLLSPRAAVETFRWLQAETKALVASRVFRKAFDIAVPVLLESKRMPGSNLKRVLEQGGSDGKN